MKRRKLPSRGKLRRLALQYVRANAARERGDLPTAMRAYQAIIQALGDQLTAIVRERLGPDGSIEDISLHALLGLIRVASQTKLGAETFDEKALRLLLTGACHDAAATVRQVAANQGLGRRPDVQAGIFQACACAIIADPWSPSAPHNLARYLEFLGHEDLAHDFLVAALWLDDTQSESWHKLGDIYALAGDRAKSDMAYDRALGCPIRSNEDDFNIAFLHLMRGNYELGWKHYEARNRCPEQLHGHGRPDLTAPMWDGSELNGTLYLHQEQGVGDALMLARYIPIAVERAGSRGRVAVEVIRALVPLFQVMFPDVQIVARADEPPPHVAQLSMFSLPFYCGTTLETIPDCVPFTVEAA